MISPYAFSKFLSVAFSQYYTSSESWKNISNDFTTQAFAIVPEYKSFQSSANKKINDSDIYFKGAEVAEREYGVAQELKREWQSYVSRFCELETMFERKYKDKISTFDEYMQNPDNRDEFLAEYSAYVFLESVYDSLAGYESYLDKFRNTCAKYKAQSQPDSN